ncbi:phytoene dehydrogenase-like protein [Bradyrhizobium sp. S3.14.4]
MSETDVIIIGAGHNGLTCAAYLAMAGLRVRVVERRKVVGGAAVTEEFHPGFRNSVAAYTVSLLNPQVIRDLGLTEQGLRIVERRAQNFLPAPDGSYLLTGEGRTKESVARLSTRDASALDGFSRELEDIADVLRQFVLRAPPNLLDGFGTNAIREVVNAIQSANILRGLTLEQSRSLLDLFTRSAGEMLDERFEHDLVKALFGFDAIVGNYASPYAAGSAYVMLHHAFGEVNGKKGVWGHAIGGMGAITQAMARAAQGRGVTIDTDAGVREIIVERDRAVGVVLDNGETIRAKYVAANVNPKLLYTRLIAADALPPDFLARIRHWKNGSGTFRMNVALDRLPSFTTLPGDGDHLTSGIILAPSLGYMDRAYLDARALGWSREPVVEMLIPSTLDDTLAPTGKHVASLFCQHVAPELPDGKSWDDHREEVADLMIATVDKYAPGFAASVLGRQILSPLDLERQFGLLGGDIFHGALTLNQLFSGAADAGPCRLSRSPEGPLSLRLRRSPRRRRHRRPRPQRRTGDLEGSPLAVRKPWIGLWKGLWTGCWQGCEKAVGRLRAAGPARPVQGGAKAADEWRDKAVDNFGETGGGPVGIPVPPKRPRPPGATPRAGDRQVTASKEKQPPPGNGRRKLLQGTANRTELVVQAGAQAVHHGDDRQRDARCDQAVFDRGCTGFVRPELQNHALQDSPPFQFQDALGDSNTRKCTGYNLQSG